MQWHMGHLAEGGAHVIDVDAHWTDWKFTHLVRQSREQKSKYFRWPGWLGVGADRVNILEEMALLDHAPAMPSGSTCLWQKSQDRMVLELMGRGLVLWGFSVGLF